MGLFSSFLDKAKGVIGKVAKTISTVAPMAKGVLGKVASVINNPTVQSVAKGVLGGKLGGVLGKASELLPKISGVIDKVEPMAKTASDIANSSNITQAVTHAKGLLPRNLKLNF